MGGNPTLKACASGSRRRTPGPNADTARISLGNVQVDQNPADAMQTALGISEPHMRQDEAVKYYRRWLRRDATAANAWLQSPSVPQDVRTVIDQRVRR